MKNIKLSSQTYEILKWVIVLVMPSLATLITALAAIWGWEGASNWSDTIIALQVFLGAIFALSTYNYNRSDDKLDKDDHENNVH